MRSFIALEYKNLLLCKKTLVFYLLLGIVGPPLLYQMAGSISSNFLPFFMVVMFISYLIYQDVSVAEYKYKGLAYLSVTPYSRKQLVIADYIFVLLTFAYCTLMHTIVSLVLPNMLQTVGINTFSISLLMFSILFGLFIPLKIKLGIQKVKIVFCILVIAIPYTIPLLLKNMNVNSFSIFQSIPKYVVPVVGIGLSLIITLVSMAIAVKIYSNKDL